MIRIVIADDHAIVREGLRALLSRHEDMIVVAEANDGQQSVEAVKKHRPDVLLLDLTMPSLNGIAALSQVRSVCPETRVLVLSMHAAPDYIRRVLHAGARGYIVKGSGLDDLVRATRTVAAGDRFLDATAARVMEHADAESSAEVDDWEQLTPREREVLQLIAEGSTNREVAERLSVSPKTVDTHRTSLMRKLDLHNAQALTRYALRRGLV